MKYLKRFLAALMFASLFYWMYFLGGFFALAMFFFVALPASIAGGVLMGWLLNDNKQKN